MQIQRLAASAAVLAAALLPLRLAHAAGLCESGLRQSPIDIGATQPRPGPALQFDYHGAPLRIVNDGHTVRVRFMPGSRLIAGGRSLALREFHFHHPGGDRLHGEEFPASMHFLHKGADGQLVALVVLLRQGAEHPALADLLPHMMTARPREQTVTVVRVDPAQWLPASRAHYAYDGSLTAAPCTEGVRWLVMKQPLTISAAQLQRLGELFAPNARPVQPLHGRVVTETP
jgi:carbonic anhydrase